MIAPNRCVGGLLGFLEGATKEYNKLVRITGSKDHVKFLLISYRVEDPGGSMIEILTSAVLGVTYL